MRRARRTPLFPFDAGWLFLLPGLVLLSATVLIPAYNDLLDARWSRDRTAVIEQSRLDRLSRYGTYLDALEREDPSVVKSLAASQLNLIPESFEPVAPPQDPSNVPATIFPLLEPEPSVLLSTPPARDRSRLEIWSTSDRTRVWLIAAGGLCVLIGLLPPAARRPTASRHAPKAPSAKPGPAGGRADRAAGSTPLAASSMTTPNQAARSTSTTSSNSEPPPGELYGSSAGGADASSSSGGTGTDPGGRAPALPAGFIELKPSTHAPTPKLDSDHHA